MGFALGLRLSSGRDQHYIVCLDASGSVEYIFDAMLVSCILPWNLSQYWKSSELICLPEKPRRLILPVSKD
jgi:hypothetical protein